jgi:hypothetical protein
LKKVAVVLGVAVAIGLAAWALWPEVEVIAAAPTPSKLAPDKPAPVYRSVDELLALAQPDFAMADAGALVLRGTVFGADGTAVAGAEVEVLPASHSPSVVSSVCDACGLPLLQCESPETAAGVASALRHARGVPVPLATTRTDAEGKYTFPLRWDGALVVRASDAAGHQAWEEFEAFEGEEPEIDLTLAARTKVVGTVIEIGGKAVAGARVLLVATSDGAHAEAVSNDQGEFEVSCPAEPCSLWTFTEAAGFAPLVMSPGVLTADDNLLQLELLRARDLEIFTRLGGEPIDAAIVVFVDGHRKELQSRGGKARLDGLGVWDLTVAASASGFTSGEQPVSLTSVHNVVELELRASARALVEVLDAQGHPAKDATVSLEGLDQHVMGETTDDGALVVLGPVGEGTYALVVDGPDGIPKSQQVDLKPGDNSFSVTLPVAKFLSGKLVGGDGKVPPPTMILAAFGAETQRATTDAETGEFRLAVGEPGPWELIADSVEDGRAQLSATAPASELVIRFDRRAGIEVRVFAEGKPAPDVMVSVMPEALTNPSRRLRHQLAAYELAGVAGRRARPMSAVTDEEGKVMIWGLEPGGVDVRVADAAFRPVLKRVTLVEGQKLEVQVQLERGAVIEGTVVGADGELVTESNFSIAPAAPEDVEGQVSRVIEDQGHFAVAGLEAGKKYVLSAETEHAVSELITVQAPARGVKLVLRPLPRTRGRVLDEAGVPIAQFDVDSRNFDTPDGRFEVPVVFSGDSATLFVSATGYATKIVDVAKGTDAGDVVLKRASALKGKVVSARGEPVPGAQVTCDICNETTSGANGAFTLSADELEYPFGVRAARGGQAGMTEVTGPGEVRVVLGPKTRVDGRSYDLEGQPAPGPVLARLLNSGETERLTADGQGRFTAELPAGRWEFQASEGEFSTVALVTGESVQVLVGGVPGTCALVVRSQTDDVRLILTQKKADTGTSRWMDGLMGGELRIPGLECGQYELKAMFNGGGGPEVTHPLELRGPVTTFTVPLPQKTAQAPAP